MKVRAPGKLVLSGAYAVLEGAPALVTAVDRYVDVDSSRSAEFVSPEVRAALGQQGAPWFDASALREGEHKLGLGSSAAILVASLAAVELESAPAMSDRELQSIVFERALAAHHAAQGGGSGVDVAASVYGGTLVFTRAASGPEASAVRLPDELVIEAWWSGVPAQTPALLASVAALAQRESALHARLLARQTQAASDALAAVQAANLSEFLTALAAQQQTLLALGEAAGVAIVTPAARELGDRARGEAAVVLPAGAGGGDFVLFYGRHPSSDEFRLLAATHGHRAVQLGFGARGVHRAE